MPKKSRLNFDEADVAAARAVAGQQVTALHAALHRLMDGEKATVAAALGLNAEYWGKSRRRKTLNVTHLLEAIALLGVQPGEFMGRALAPPPNLGGSAEAQFLEETRDVFVPGLDDSIGSKE